MLNPIGSQRKKITCLDDSKNLINAHSRTAYVETYIGHAIKSTEL